MPFKKGNKLAGSRKGISNKWTREFKTNVEDCFNEIGGLPGLVRWAKKNRDEFYSKLYTKLAPLQFTGQVKVDHEHEFDGALEAFSRIVDSQVNAIAARRDHLKLIEGTASKDSEAPAHVGSVRKT